MTVVLLVLKITFHCVKPPGCDGGISIGNLGALLPGACTAVARAHSQAAIWTGVLALPKTKTVLCVLTLLLSLLAA